MTTNLHSIKTALNKPRCPKCNVPLNKDGSHNKNFMSECDEKKTFKTRKTPDMSWYNSDDL